jgi:hypothetical protein
VTQPLTFFDAALKVLREKGRAMTTTEVVAECLRRGLIDTSGKTPGASMSSVLYRMSQRPQSPIRRRFKAGSQRAVRGTVRWVAVVTGADRLQQ